MIVKNLELNYFVVPHDPYVGAATVVNQKAF